MAGYNILLMEIIGRKKEIETLQDCLSSASSRLIAVYGRRRIGKTYLIRKYFAPHLIFDITGLHHGLLTDQLTHFKNTLQKAGHKDAIETPQSWLSAFYMLESYIDAQPKKNKKVIFIDEMPWFDTPKSKFLMAFENFWNSYCVNRNDLIVVICGSAASWMIQKILNNKGGLYNRVTEKINLQPFTLNETAAFLANKGIRWGQYDIIQLYMSTGGVPFYLDQVKKSESVTQFIDRVCFVENGFLQNEFQELFASLFDNSNRHYAIVQALSKVKKGIRRDELLEASGLSSGGTFTKTLDELLASGFVKKYMPFQSNINMALYRLSDPFTLFFLQFMEHSRAKGEGTWLKKSATQAWISWSGLAFENICLQHIKQIKEALKITVIYTEETAWKGSANDQQAQIDMLIERADRIIHVCEIKFAKASFTIDKKYAQELREKLQVFAVQPECKRKNIFLTTITTFGVKDNEYKKELVQNEVTMEDLFLP